MDHVTKLSNALAAVLNREQEIHHCKTTLADLESEHKDVLAEAIRQMKSFGKDRVFYRGTTFELGDRSSGG